MQLTETKTKSTKSNQNQSKLPKPTKIKQLTQNKLSNQNHKTTTSRILPSHTKCKQQDQTTKINHNKGNAKPKIKHQSKENNEKTKPTGNKPKSVKTQNHQIRN